MNPPTNPPSPSRLNPPRRGVVSRRALLRGGLALSPAVVLGAWGGSTLLTRTSTKASAATAQAAQSTPACVVTPQLTEGPYFVDELIYRSDIRSDPTDGTVKDGVPLYLNFLVSQTGTASCAPLAGAALDVWQCDALGVYSDVSDPGFNTKGKKFLRGTQHTDAGGAAQFLTIYPGWYRGRTVHIHFKVRTDPGAQTGYTFTSQLFFDDALTDLVDALQPYASKGQRDTRNANDGIYQQSNGQLTLDVALTPDGSAYTATFAVGVDLSAPQQPSGLGGPGGGPPPGAGQ